MPKLAALVKLKSKWFETKEGEEALANYQTWEANTGNADSDEIKKRKEKLLASGLVKQSVSLKGGFKDRIIAILKKEKKAQTVQELTDKLNAALEKEGEGQTTNLKAVTFYLKCHAEKAKIKENNGSYSI